jgi:hypothetical protein
MCTKKYSFQNFHTASDADPSRLFGFGFDLTAKETDLDPDSDPDSAVKLLNFPMAVTVSNHKSINTFT